jgi:general secretion pathway protein F
MVRAAGPGGAIETLSVEAATIDEARRCARADGWMVLDARAAEGPGAATPSWLERAKPLDLGLFARELASLLEAGIGVVDGLRTLAERDARSGHQGLLLGIVRDLEQGRTLSSALDARALAFPQFFVASVRAAERSGDLAVSLRRFANGHEQLRVLRARLAGAAIYPALLLGVGALVIVFLLGFVVPRFAALLDSAGRQLPFASRILMSWGTFVAAHGGAALAAVAASVTIALIALRTAAVRAALLRLIVRLPLIGPTLRGFRRAQFYRATAMLVEGGTPAVRALELAADVMLDDDRRALAVAVAQISQGIKPSVALHAAGIADGVAQRMLRVAESTGQLGPVLGSIGAFSEQELGHRVDLMTRLVEPALMVFIGLVIGGIVVLMYLPIFELASSLQ